MTMSESGLALESAVLELAELVAELRQRDTDMRVFGAAALGGGQGGHQYGFRPPARPDAVKAFEHSHQFRLPDDYRTFILKVADGGAGPYYGLKSLANASRYCQLEKEFPWTSKVTLHDEKEYEFWENRPGVLALSHRGCGYFDLLVVRGSMAGQIWSDFTDTGGSLLPTGQTFLKWYHSWACRCLETMKREPLLEQVRIGMPADELAQLLGDESKRWLGLGVGPGEYHVRFVNIAAEFVNSTDARIKKISRDGHIY